MQSFKSSVFSNCRNKRKKIIFCSDPSWGGRNYILKWGFFVQSIFADRYIHRRELRLVSLESSSNVEYGIKKIFLIFVFYRELSRFKLRGLKYSEFTLFYSHFPKFLPNFSSILIKFLEIFKNKVVDFVLRTNKPCWLFWFNFFGQKLWINISKLSLFHQEQHEISYFSSLW